MAPLAKPPLPLHPPALIAPQRSGHTRMACGDWALLAALLAMALLYLAIDTQ